MSIDLLATTPPRRDGLTLIECVALAVSIDGFVDEWERVRGMKLGNTPIDRMIDEATGYDRVVCDQFVADVKELVFDTAPSMEQQP